MSAVKDAGLGCAGPEDLGKPGSVPTGWRPIQTSRVNPVVAARVGGQGAIGVHSGGVVSFWDDGKVLRPETGSGHTTLH